MKKWKDRNDQETVLIGMWRRFKKATGWRRNRLLVEIIGEVMA